MIAVMMLGRRYILGNIGNKDPHGPPWKLLIGGAVVLVVVFAACAFWNIK